jgi:hypothetical protein
LDHWGAKTYNQINALEIKDLQVLEIKDLETNGYL